MNERLGAHLDASGPQFTVVASRFVDLGTSRLLARPRIAHARRRRG